MKAALEGITMIRDAHLRILQAQARLKLLPELINPFFGDLAINAGDALPGAGIFAVGLGQQRDRKSIVVQSIDVREDAHGKRVLLISDKADEYDMSELGIIPNPSGVWTREYVSFANELAQLGRAYRTLTDKILSDHDTDPVIRRCASSLGSYLGIRG